VQKFRTAITGIIFELGDPEHDAEWFVARIDEI
jgi:hypothetical protein